MLIGWQLLMRQHNLWQSLIYIFMNLFMIIERQFSWSTLQTKFGHSSLAFAVLGAMEIKAQMLTQFTSFPFFFLHINSRHLQRRWLIASISTQAHSYARFPSTPSLTRSITSTNACAYSPIRYSTGSYFRKVPHLSAYWSTCRRNAIVQFSVRTGPRRR